MYLEAETYARKPFYLHTGLPLKGHKGKWSQSVIYLGAPLWGKIHKLPLWASTLTSTNGGNANRLLGTVFALGIRAIFECL
jgi:hypothetical protein